MGKGRVFTKVPVKNIKSIIKGGKKP